MMSIENSFVLGSLKQFGNGAEVRVKQAFVSAHCLYIR